MPKDPPPIIRGSEHPQLEAALIVTFMIAAEAVLVILASWLRY